MNIVNFSGGKDSTAMLLRLIETGVKIDKIVFADTGFEFKELYDYIKKIEDYIKRPITILHPETTFEEWFSGGWTKGKLEGEPRGFPQVLTPCYWTRESKVKPLEKMQKEATEVYVGIAYDEQHRMMKEAGKIRYPLIDWKWTEQDCIDYLNKKGLFNPLYVNFNRLGCWMCPKQGINSLYVLWKLYPDKWKELLEWEKRNQDLTGRDLTLQGPLIEMGKRFESGDIPKDKVKYDCWDGCESVKKAYRESQKGLNSFKCE